MDYEKKVSLAKKFVEELSLQGGTVEDLLSICIIIKKIAEKTVITKSCVDSFKGWLD